MTLYGYTTTTKLSLYTPYIASVCLYQCCINTNAALVLGSFMLITLYYQKCPIDYYIQSSHGIPCGISALVICS